MSAAALLGWYGREARDLPWRRTRDPYRILVSEVMLQQTRVARVVPRYEAWVERWPDPAALAAAPVADVLREWVGLGYNRRALRLREAAAVVARDGWPEDLTALPGVGAYTAAAVGSFAFGRQEVAVDTNVRRVRERYGAVLAPPAGEAAAFNHAMMDLGATICTARVARCEACPVAEGCGARARGGPSAGGSRRGGASAGGASSAGGGRAERARFEDTDRFARGRIVAALAAGEPLPGGLGAHRTERALGSLERDGLVERSPDGRVRLPRQ